MKTCSTVNVSCHGSQLRYSAQNKLWLNYFSCLGKLKKIPKFPGIKVSWTGSPSRQSYVRHGFLPEKKIVRFSFGCLDALGQTRKQQGKSTVNARVGEKHERTFFCLFNYCLNDWKTETTCYKYFIYSVTSDKNIDFDPYRISPFQFRCKVHFYRKLVSWLLYKEHNITWKTRAERF